MNWISVKDRMPDVGKKVLCATVYIYDNKFCRDYSIGIFYNDTGWECICETDVVTHWAEIEEPMEGVMFYCNTN